MEKNYYLPSAEDSGGKRHDNRLNPISAFQKTIADAEEKPEEFDVSAVYDKTLNYVKWMIGPRRSDETSDAYRARVFAELLGMTNHDDDDDDDRDRTGSRHRWDDRDLLVLYAREAAESGRPEKARRSYLRLIAGTGAADPAYWLLYGAFCARDGDRDEALACAGRAVALDGRDKFALFARAALLMTAADSDGYGELDALLDALAAAHPRFAEGHALAAVHYSRMDMPGRADRSLSLAGRFAAADDDDGAADGADRLLRIGLDAVWRPVTGCDGGDVDPAVKCASLLCRLELADLAATCLRRFAAARADPYHYAMAVAHYRRAEYAASADHLNSMACRRSAADDGDGGAWTLLAAHVDYAAGRYREAVVWYVGLSLVPHQHRYGLAYSRAAGHFAANSRYAEAAEAYHRACAAIPAPALMTKLAACLVALDRRVEAERLLVGAVAADGEYDGDAWHQLAALYGAAGRVEMADVCGRRASELGYESDLFRRLRKI
ncbi:cilia- and flagella-associated protein 70-like isoform X3 [Aphis craccivora]|uniref:Cilia-and flagella-associated protein 70-like isoform X3 n=1 Tax=Aphis craccivora TaxID=307492 RepID=A0A6G0Z5P1_APHCR|nr:cilia- and flagella-associated protein 70-like isoform X3 [Aphis craccivora]